MYKFLGQHAASGFGAGAGKAAIDHTVRHAFGLAAKRRPRRRSRRRAVDVWVERDIGVWTVAAYWHDDPVNTKSGMPGGYIISTSLTPEQIEHKFKTGYATKAEAQGVLRAFVKGKRKVASRRSTKGRPQWGRANRCPRGKSPRRGYRRADGTRVRATCVKNRRR